MLNPMRSGHMWVVLAVCRPEDLTHQRANLESGEFRFKSITVLRLDAVCTLPMGPGKRLLVNLNIFVGAVRPGPSIRFALLPSEVIICLEPTVSSHWESLRSIFWIPRPRRPTHPIDTRNRDSMKTVLFTYQHRSKVENSSSRKESFSEPAFPFENVYLMLEIREFPSLFVIRRKRG